MLTSGDPNAGWVARSQYSNPGDAEPIDLLPARTIPMPRAAGEEWCDRHCQQRRVRDFDAFTVDFPTVRIWKITDVCLSEGLVISRGSEVFIDASIFSQGSSGQQEAQILEAHCAILENCMHTVLSDYSDETALVVHNEGGGTWGHFLVQNFPKILLYLKHFPEGKIAVPTQHKVGVYGPGPAQLLRLFGVPAEQLIPVDPGVTYRFKALFVMDFLFDFKFGVIHPEALNLVRAGAEGLRPAESPGPFSAPMLIEREPRYSGRRISNPAALQATLKSHGIALGELGARPMIEQIDAWRSGRLMISALGSDLSNMIFAPPGTPILALTPDWFGDDFFFRLASACEHPWYEVRCGRRTSEHEIEHRADFDVDPAMLELALGRITMNHGGRI